MERRPIDDTSRAVAALLRDPVWQLVMVSQEGSGPCTECGTGLDDMDEPAHADFAYTVGLHEWFGRPEVHCGGLSTDDDPGSVGYELLAEIVNTVAARTVAREIGPGSEFEITASNGHGHCLLRFTLGIPSRPLAVSAYMAHPEATVIPIRWTIVESECPCQEAS